MTGLEPSAENGRQRVRRYNREASNISRDRNGTASSNCLTVTFWDQRPGVLDQSKIGKPDIAKYDRRASRL